MRKPNSNQICSLLLHPSLRLRHIRVVARPTHLARLPQDLITASLPQQLQKTCEVSQRWTTCQRLQGNKAEEGSHTPKGKQFYIRSSC